MTQARTSVTDALQTTTAGITPTQLAELLNEYLQVGSFHDYCPNGLQIDADQPIHKIVTGVTASQALIEQAIARHVQAIVVHHGYFWKGEPAPLIGMKGKRVRLLMQHGISLLAYHLPLDAHPIVGNNAQLAQALGWQLNEALYPQEKMPVGNIVNLTLPISPVDLSNQLTQILGRVPLHLSGNNALLQRIGICTGGAQDMIEQAAMRGCDAYISGEVSERTTHAAQELGIDYFACGHHATERGGIKALGNYIFQQFGLAVEFIDIDNPV